MRLVVTVPAAAAVIVVVVLFLRAQKTFHVQHSETVKEVTERATKCHDECTTAVKETGAAVSENTKVLTKLSTLVEHRIKQEGG